MNSDLDEILTLRARHFCALVDRLRAGLEAQGLSVSADVLVTTAASLYEIDDDERLYGEDDEDDED